MTTEQLKAAAIEKAWIAETSKKFWEKYSRWIENIDGMIDSKYLDVSDFSALLNDDDFKRYGYGFRPKSLEGIEDNNGWTRIEPDGSNLPTDHRRYETCFYIEKYVYDIGNEGTSEDIKTRFFNGIATHYRLIEKHKPPIY